MNWIKLLYPKPEFDLSGYHPLIRAIHSRALKIAYYLTQTLALLILFLVYCLLIMPMNWISRMKNEDLLEEKMDAQRESYLKVEDSLKDFDITRMY